MVAILMATYNGEKYLKEQIDSILNQTFSDFKLYIRDDNSTDRTREIISSYNDPRITYMSGENLGPAGCFFELLRKATEFDYIFFSDQDDIWFQDKLEKMLKEIKKISGPAMVFSDFSMIDSSGKTTSLSFAKYSNLQVEPGEVGINKIIAQPFVFGCASVINRELADMVLNPPENIEMHDCWISLVACCAGKLIYMDEPTIAHRFHDSNATGRSGQASLASRIKRITKGFNDQTLNSKLRLSQVNLLLENLDGKINAKSLDILLPVSAAMKKSRFATVLALKKAGISRQKLLNTLFFYITVLSVKGDF